MTLLNTRMNLLHASNKGDVPRQCSLSQNKVCKQTIQINLQALASRQLRAAQASTNKQLCRQIHFQPLMPRNRMMVPESLALLVAVTSEKRLLKNMREFAKKFLSKKEKRLMLRRCEKLMERTKQSLKIDTISHHTSLKRKLSQQKQAARFQNGSFSQ